MLITPETFKTKETIKHTERALIGVYLNLLRFNKRADKLIGLPNRLAFDFDEMMMMVSPDGFEVRMSKSWREHVIFSRPLAKYVLRKFNTDKVMLEVIPHGAGYRLSVFRKSVDGTRDGNELEVEGENMMRIG